MYIFKHLPQNNYMKILPIVLACASLAAPVCDYKVGNLIESNKFNNVSICSEGKLFRENIEIRVSNGSEEIVVEPSVNIGYNPTLFVANFLNNGLEQVLYSVESGGSGGYSFYQMFSFADERATSVFNSEDFKPNITASYKEENLIEIDYQGKKLYLDSSNSGCQNHDDCNLYISDVNTILPFYNIALDRYYLQVLQRIYGGYEANNFGYISSLLEINEDGFTTISIGTLSIFSY